MTTTRLPPISQEAEKTTSSGIHSPLTDPSKLCYKKPASTCLQRIIENETISETSNTNTKTLSPSKTRARKRNMENERKRKRQKILPNLSKQHVLPKTKKDNLNFNTIAVKVFSKMKISQAKKDC